MKRFLILTAICITFSASGMNSLSAYAQNASIRFDISRPTGQIDRNIYGVFEEPIGRANGVNIVYGPLYNPESPLANADGFRTDVIDAMKELRIPCMRWPGGNYISNYNWQDGIGPKENRPVRIDPAWGGKDTNQVGTDEWVALNRAIGSENVVCLNLAFGSLDQTRYWLEYCNLPTGSYYSDLRAKYGHEEPFNVKYWCLGNEVDGKPWIMGHRDKEDYAKTAYEVAKLLRALDPSVKFVASGSSWYENSPNGTTPRGQWIDWNHTVIKELYGMADYISIHRYWEYFGEYYDRMADNVMDVEEKILVTKSLIDIEKANYPQKRPMFISFDEWSASSIGGFASTLGNAQFLNAFVRHSDIVKMANYTMMTSLLSTDMTTGETFKGPFYQIFKLYSTNCEGNAVDTVVDCGNFDGQVYKGVPYLNVTCVHNPENGKVFINVVNVNKEDSITADIIATTGACGKQAKVSTVDHALDENFSKAGEASYVPSVSSESVKDGKLTHTFPAHSFTQIEISVK